MEETDVAAGRRKGLRDGRDHRKSKKRMGLKAHQGIIYGLALGGRMGIMPLYALGEDGSVLGTLLCSQTVSCVGAKGYREQDVPARTDN